MACDYDVCVIGSGFGGATTALRLTEKGYKVCVLEAGRRFGPDTYAKSSWQSRRFLWMPHLGMRGIQRITPLRDVLVLSGAGVGGGSLVYAQTHYEPSDAFYEDRHWAHITDWKAELRPWYDQARRMLGTAENRWDTPADRALRRVAAGLGVQDTFRQTPVGVFFGEPGVEVEDPYFGGAGPRRAGCIGVGACMVGCRWNAKNTLDRNYLYLAERNGCEVLPERQVVKLAPRAGGGYEVTTVRPGAWLRTRTRTYTAENVVVSAAVMGTLGLLSKMRDAGHLPDVSPRLGELVRTNSEALVGASTLDESKDFSKGVAITSSIYPDEHTHIQPVRYPDGSDAMAMLTTILVGPGTRLTRPLKFLAKALRRPRELRRATSIRGWARHTVTLLVMQNLDNSLRIIRKKGPFGLGYMTSRQGEGTPNPRFIAVANKAAKLLAKEIGGYPRSAWNEVLFNIPTTAHILGGATIGLTPEEGVIDPYHRVHGYPGLYVVDGSSITANLGVNPSLTITAMAERAASLWPNKGEADLRPALGEPYRHLDAVRPLKPAVPAGAPAELRYGEPDGAGQAPNGGKSGGRRSRVPGSARV